MSKRNRNETMAEWSDRLEARYARLETATHYVYRAYDEFDFLLYVGCTVNLQGRLSAHLSSSPWRPYMVRHEFETYAGLKAARAAELALINAEQTPFNATQDDVNRTQANLHGAKRYLANLGIFAPQFDIAEGEIETFAQTPEWATYVAESEAYSELLDEMRADLKATDFPYLEPEDRLANYLAIRDSMEAAA